MRRLLCALVLCALLLTACSAPPEKPAALRVSVSGRNAELSWDKSSEAHTYRLYRKYSDEKDFKFICDCEETSYTDKYLNPDRKYTYKLELIGEGGTSEAVTSDTVAVSEAPVMQAVVQKKQGEFMLRWTGKKNSSFEIYGKTSGGSRMLGEVKGFEKLVKADSGITGFYVTDKSTKKSSDTLNALRQPQITAVTQLDETTAVLELSSDVKSSYEVYRSASQSGEYTLAGRTDEPYFYDTKVTRDSTYFYKARAVKGKSSSLTGSAEQTGKNAKSVFGVPVMMYHEFVTKSDLKSGIAFDEYAIYQSEFESDLKWLKSNGYTTITCRQLSDYLEGKGTMPSKPIILSIDDGKYGVYKRAFPILKKYGMKAVLSVIGTEIDLATVTPGYMEENPAPYCTWDEIKEMYDSGAIDMESHTQFLHVFNHDGRHGANCAENETVAEFLPMAQKDWLEISRNINTHLGYTPCAMAYPYSIRCETADRAWLKSGYKLLLAGDREDVRMSEVNYFVRDAGLNLKSSVLRRITRMTGTPIAKYIG